MKPILEQIKPTFQSSFTARRFTEAKTCKPSFWHFHPEFEIVLITKGAGKRHIGSHVSWFVDGTLIFLGPNLPHFCFTDEVSVPHEEIVIQMQEHFLGKSFWESPEMSAIAQLFERARHGLVFGDLIKNELQPTILQMEKAKGLTRLLYLLDILQQLALTTDVEHLQIKDAAFTANTLEYERMQRIYTIVETEFQHPISIKRVAEEIGMTAPSFCRYFKKVTDKTFVQFLTEYRIAHACHLLNRKHNSIAEISYQSGFQNISHFNRAFKNITGEQPSTYRKNLRMIVRR